MKKHIINNIEYSDFPIVSHAPISTKLCNFFFGRDIKTLEDAKKITKEEFLKCRNMGCKTWNELQEYIKTPKRE